MKLPKNLGRIDRPLYIIVGIGAVVFALAGWVSGAWRIWLAMLGAVIALEGVVGF